MRTPIFFLLAAAASINIMSAEAQTVRSLREVPVGQRQVSAQTAMNDCLSAGDIAAVGVAEHRPCRFAFEGALRVGLNCMPGDVKAMELGRALEAFLQKNPNSKYGMANEVALAAANQTWRIETCQ